MDQLTEERIKKIQEKVEKSKKFIAEVLDKYDLKDIAVAWTGGKDSTLILWMIKEVCEEKGIPIPENFCIDEGDMFQEIRDFLDEWKEKWNVNLVMLHNDDVTQASGGKIGSLVKVADLNERNKKELERLGYDKDEFMYEAESYVGNHLMKTGAMNEYLDRKQLKGFFEGIRWDEQSSRAEETYYSPREATSCNPEHMRFCPILHFTEKDVWDAHFANDIPICKLYKEGYRSLGARGTTHKTTDVPAWKQDLANTTERQGRRQDKESLMDRLRKVGYMQNGLYPN